MSSQPTSGPMREILDNIYQAESRRILATLIRLLGDFDLAEDALQEAFQAGMEQWPRDGIPANPRTWLISVGRFKAIDALRRRTRFEAPLDELAERRIGDKHEISGMDVQEIEDDRLRLIFTCCHPLLPPEARAALTLREVCGLTTEAIAQAYLTNPSTLAQRIVRAKAKIRSEHIPYEVPARAELPARLETVLQVIYLVFNEGYSASEGDSLTRPDLSDEAIRLGRLLVELLPEPEAIGLLALMLIHESRRSARSSEQGDLILLEAQDRTLWNRDQIREGLGLVRAALFSGRVGQYTLQATIAAVHAVAPTFASTDWTQIVTLYDNLAVLAPSPIVKLNRAVAVGMRDGPAAGLTLIDVILAQGDLSDYHLAYSARAELCRRLGRTQEARAAYERAIALARQEPEKRFLVRRLAELSQDNEF